MSRTWVWKNERKAKYRDINDIIDRHLKPRLASECQRRGISASFIAGIYGIYPEIDCSSCCEPIREEGKVREVRIRIDSEIRSPLVAILHFWHEMRHAKDYYEDCKAPEGRAYLYMLKRGLEELIKPITRSGSRINLLG